MPVAPAMTEYYVPAGTGGSEYDEKRSRFLGRVFPVSSEEEARAHIEQVKKQHYDARHNCWCYLLKDGPERYSDDGEPQGTAGVPMLEVFRREGVTNLCCVVTRYFGGVLLGAGGLLRAYTKAAKEALDDAGLAVVRPWDRVRVECPYPLFERVRQLAEKQGGSVEDAAYAEAVTLTILLPEGGQEPFAAALTELSAGGLQMEFLEKVEKSAPQKEGF